MKKVRIMIFLMLGFILIGIILYMLINNYKNNEINLKLLNFNSTPTIMGLTPIHCRIIKYDDEDYAFINPRIGWKVTYKYLGMFTEDKTIYRTSNGGKNWVKIKELNIDGSSSGITFINSKIGWMTTNSPRQGYIGLYKTCDGGITWKNQKLVVPSIYSNCEIYLLPPVFFSKDDGILITEQCDIHKQLIFVTHDNGKTWKDINNNSNDNDFVCYFQKSSNTLSKGQWKVIYKKQIWKSYNGYTWYKY